MDSKKPSRGELIEMIGYVLANAPDRISAERLRDVTVETTRPNRRHPAQAVLAVSDATVKALRGDPEAGPEVLIVVLDREVLRRRESKIILPGEHR